MEVRSRRPWVPHLFLVLLLPHVLLSTGQSSYNPSGWRNVYEDTGSPRRRRGCNPVRLPSTCISSSTCYFLLQSLWPECASRLQLPHDDCCEPSATACLWNGRAMGLICMGL